MTGMPLFCDPDLTVADTLRVSTGGVGVVFADLGSLRDHLLEVPDDDTLVLGPGVLDDEAFAVADYMRVHRPSLGVVLVRREVTTPLLQEALRSGVREVVHERDALGLGTAVQRSAHLAAAMRNQPGALNGAAVHPQAGSPLSPPQGVPGRKATVVTVFAAKGGCGKTTLATNLAVALADRGRARVCIVDLDLAFGDVAITMHLVPSNTIADAVPLNGKLDPTAVEALLTHHSSGLSAVVAPTEPSAAEQISPGLISHLLEVLRAEFDYVVIDTPPSFDDQILAALDVSDVIALVVTPDVPALKNLKIAIETLTELGYPADRLRLVLNRADAKVGITHAEVERTARMPCSAQIPSSRDVPASINRGVPIVLDDPRHGVSQAIRQFASSQLPQLASSLDRYTQVNGHTGHDAGTQRRGLMKKRRPRTS
ncbi:CpaE family protein [Spongisporangium articulatum]|uniref:CpaE family protein n=1 Tax=Spongisporangium articulatum TaxID=3362603 RepID=A0ABW8ATQ6_9ACTN